MGGQWRGDRPGRPRPGSRHPPRRRSAAREAGPRSPARPAGGVRLTDAGELLVSHADAVLARLQDAEDELGALLGLRAGRLRMSTLTSAATTIVPPAIAEFRQRLPGVELSVAMLDPAGV